MKVFSFYQLSLFFRRLLFLLVLKKIVTYS
ncbi:hypothetical protein YPPY103_4192, partial [Yersinia pestis PY-103]